jgi:hypothetical protein
MHSSGSRRAQAEPGRRKPGGNHRLLHSHGHLCHRALEQGHEDIHRRRQGTGGEVLVQLSAGGTKEQIAQINFLVNRKIDVLVVIAHDTEMIAGAIKQVKDSGIPVVAYDRMIMGVPIDAYISFDNMEVGRLFGRALTAAVPRGRYLVVNGSVRDTNSYQVNAGLVRDSGSPDHVRAGYKWRRKSGCRNGVSTRPLKR